MDWFISFLTNPFLITSLSSWFVAQILKTFIHFFVYKKFDIRRLFGDGGMPSGHSATVTSLAVFCALSCGTGSVQFAISLILAIIVCHDAMGVRLETGKQAILLNEIIKSFEVFNSEKLTEVKLKEFVGHTPIQVLAGMIVGILNAFFMYFIIF